MSGASRVCTLGRGQAYRSFPRELRAAFPFGQLHLGHLATSFALREAPREVVQKERCPGVNLLAVLAVLGIASWYMCASGPRYERTGSEKSTGKGRDAPKRRKGSGKGKDAGKGKASRQAKGNSRAKTGKPKPGFGAVDAADEFAA